MKIRKTGTAMLLVGALLFGAIPTANAANEYVEGKLEANGALVQYYRTRMYTFTGPITLSVTKMPSGHLRLGLRNMNVPGGPHLQIACNGMGMVLNLGIIF